MTRVLQTIEPSGPDTYRVTVGGPNGTLSFQLRVEMVGDIPVVVSDERFIEYMQRNMTPASPIMAAVQAFYLARAAVLP